LVQGALCQHEVDVVAGLLVCRRHLSRRSVPSTMRRHGRDPHLESLAFKLADVQETRHNSELKAMTEC